jgi:L-alanine-DL-glutamate epimerase-like enolase superfamily enzyme
VGANILTLETRAIDLALAERFAIARETWDVTRNVFARVGYGDEYGVGEASPAARWNESVDSVLGQLERVDLSALRSPFDLEAADELLPAGSARAAFNIALHDLAAKLAGISVSDLLGAPSDRLPPTSVTIPITNRASMVKRAEAFGDHPVLKMKVGFDGDVDAVAAVREIFGGAIRIDANEGWAPEEAAPRLKKMERLEIELCEQPVPAGDHDGLESVTRSTSIPIYADEDACTAADVARLAGVVDGVNLKLRKAGGIRELVRAVAVARAHDMGVMIGCDLDSGIAITAGAHAASLVDYVDLDGPLLLEKDPFPGVSYDRGRLVLPPGPGLGVTGTPW